MGIGVTVGRQYQPTVAQKLQEPGVIAPDWITASGIVPLIQGAEMAVAAQGDSGTGLLAPPIPGGLQMQKVIYIVQGQPIQVDLAVLLDAWRRLHLFVNFEMPKKGWF